VLGLLYGPNSGLANLSRFRLPEFDRLYDESKRLPDGPQRAKLVGEMSKLVAAYAPWKLTAYRIENIAVYPWVVGFKYNPFNQNPWQYLDIDLGVPRKAVQ
jgi:ABC-type transport system substrate-binding protein